MKKKLFNIYLLFTLSSLALLISSCGGGGGGSSGGSGSGNVSVFGSSGWNYADLFNNHTWENTNGANKITLAFNNSKITRKHFVNGVEQTSYTATAAYELIDAKEMGKKGKIKCSCINSGAETEFTFDKLVSPDTVTMNYNGASLTFTRQ